MKHTAATKRKCTAIRVGRRHTDEAKARISAGLKRRIQQFGPFRRYERQPAAVTIPTGADLAYLAGIIDGEGSIRFREGRPFVAVYNTNTDLMDWLFRKTGRAGKVTDRRGRLPCYTWQVAGANDLLALCQALRPYLVVKLDDANRVLQHLRQKYGMVA